MSVHLKGLFNTLLYEKSTVATNYNLENKALLIHRWHSVIGRKSELMKDIYPFQIGKNDSFKIVQLKLCNIIVDLKSICQFFKGHNLQFHYTNTVAHRIQDMKF